MILTSDLPIVSLEASARVFSAQFEFFNSSAALTSANALEEAAPTRSSAFSSHRDHPWQAGQDLARKPSAYSSQNVAQPFNLQFAEASPFKEGQPLNLAGGYDQQSQQWIYAGDALPSWSWIGGYDTIICSRDVVVSEVSKQWCSAGGTSDVQWDEWLEDVYQHDEDMP